MMRTSHVFEKSVPLSMCRPSSSRAMSSTWASSARARSSDRTVMGTARASSYRPSSTSQRGGLGHPQHADEQRDRRECAHGEHVAPDPVVVPPDRVDDGVHDEGGELPRDDSEFVAARDGSADLERGELGQVDRHHRRGAADRQPEHDAPGHEHGIPGREHDEQGSAEEEDREDDDRLASSQGVRQLAACERADCGRKDERADDDAQGEVAHAELDLHGAFGAVAHAGVVSEQQPTEAGDDGDQSDPLAVRSGCERRQRLLTHDD